MTHPRWGTVTAEPHEFLIHIRGGKIRRSGQGASCFKLPGDSVALVSTAISKLSFVADQVTREKTGVEVTGLAVYRIVDPLLAHRMLDLDRLALTDILRDMFVGATRRIVASLTLEECITHRKERVAAALMSEISPVLGGQGADEDTTSMGWGVVIDTIEIQNVRVLSEEVFARLQAPYREQLALAALAAEDEVKRERERREADRAKQAESDRRALMQEEEQRIAAERVRAAEEERHRATLAEARERAEDARALARTQAATERAALELSTRQAAEEYALDLERRRRDLPDLSEARLAEQMQTETLPALAQAFRGSFDKITIAPPEGDLFGFLTGGLDATVAVGRRHRRRGEA
jgi:flotillin